MFKVIKGSNDPTPNHFGCSWRGHRANSQTPQYREFALCSEIRIARRDGIEAEYVRPFYQCNTCGHCMTTREQAEDAIENMEFALYEIEIMREFGK